MQINRRRSAMYPQVIQFETRKIEREAAAQLVREQATETKRPRRFARIVRRSKHVEAYCS
jgi:hypothetical protein